MIHIGFLLTRYAIMMGISATRKVMYHHYVYVTWQHTKNSSFHLAGFFLCVLFSVFLKYRTFFKNFDEGEYESKRMSARMFS